MRNLLSGVIALFCLCFTAQVQAADTPAYYRIHTSMGDIDIALEVEKAPLTVENFRRYADEGLYNRTIIHRVIDDVLIQGGGFNRFYRKRATYDPVPSESDNGLNNVRGTVAMARFADPDSATNQWFINLRHNDNLDRRGEEFDVDAGYTVFAKVVSGMDVADAIGDMPTGPPPASAPPDVPLEQDVPADRIMVIKVRPMTEEEIARLP